MVSQNNHKQPRFHLIYYALAAFDVFTIGISLLLNHLLIDSYSRSLESSYLLQERLEQYEKISELAGEVNAPGNDVFDSLDVKTEKDRMLASLTLFNTLLQQETAKLEQISDSNLKNSLRENFQRIRHSMSEMTNEALKIFQFFEKKDAKKAGSRMATMDRKYGVLNGDLRNLRSQVQKWQLQYLTAEKSRVHELQRYEYGLAMSVILIVMLVTIYGKMIARKFIESQKQIEEQQLTIIESSKMASLGIMAGGVAHEINNPLAVIKGYIGQLKNSLQKNQHLDPKITAQIGKIEKGVERIATIVRGLKLYSRDSSDDPFLPIPLKDLIEDPLAFCSEQIRSKNVKLHIHIDNPELQIHCRAPQISQIIVNLLNNAADAISGFSEPWIKVITQSSTSEVTIRIEDCGIGIPPEIANKLMTPFFTTKEVGKGTGLGLSISLGIAKDHSGKLELVPKAKNTTFELTLPIHPPESKKQAA